MKDNFSENAANYKQFRPEYPKELFDFIIRQTSRLQKAWDCGTGNGQVAKGISPYFDAVEATDISVQQLMNAEFLPNVSYSQQAAESCNFADNSFDLIIVGQAVHWFDFDKFYAEVRRTAKKDSILALIGYGRLKINPEIDKIIDVLYFDLLGKYWDAERKHIDNQYNSLPFPFEELTCPKFVNKQQWNDHQLIGYLETWSALKHYQKIEGKNPIDSIRNELEQAWNGVDKVVEFPILTRIGKIK